jgi:hypothetical protein
MLKYAIVLGVATAFQAIAASAAWAADLPNNPAPPPGANAFGTTDLGYFQNWFARVDEAQATQPHWITPLVTVTPRLEEEVRYDQLFQSVGNGSTIDNFGGGKGLELIPTTTNEVIFNAPPYMQRNIVRPVSGFGDWPFFLVKQRLLSANEESGNYIVTAFLSAQAPTGAPAFTNNAWLITPTLAGGKGWGDFDIQGTVGVAIPTSHENIIGTAIATNVTAQYHIAKYFWPEVELNDTFWSGGARDGKNQLFITPGIVLGRFDLGWRAKMSVGLGYQIALAPQKQILEPLTPTYNHEWILSVRVAF